MLKMNARRTMLAAAVATTSLVANAHAQTLYWGGGTSDIADGDPLPWTFDTLGGNWTTSLKNWSTATSGSTTFDVWQQGAFANLGFGVVTSTTTTSTIVPNFSPTVSGMFYDATAAVGNNRNVSLSPAAAQTLTLTGDRAVFLTAAGAVNSISGISFGSNLTLGASTTRLVKDGAGNLNLSGNNNAYTGVVDLRAGNLNLGTSAGTLAGVTDIRLAGYRMASPSGTSNGGNEWSQPNLVYTAPNSAANQLSDNAIITLQRGAFSWTNGGTSSNETIRQIVLDNHGIYGSSIGATTNAAYVALTDTNQGLVRGTTGTMIIIATDSAEWLRSGLRIQNLGTGAGAIPGNVLLPWFTTSRAEFVQVDTSDNNTVKRIPSTTNNNLSTWTAGQNYRIEASASGSISSDLSINALGVRAASTLNIGSGVTLTIASGGLANQGVPTTIQGGNLTTTASQFYMSTGQANSGNLTVKSILTGNFDLIKSGETSLTLDGTAGPNTFTGNLIINSGDVILGKSGAVPNGDVIINTGGGLQLNDPSDSLRPGVNITMGRDASLYFNTGTNVGGSLIVNGGFVTIPNKSPTLSGPGTGFQFNGGAVTQNSTGAGALNLYTNVSYAASSQRQAVIQRFNTGGFAVNLNTDTGSPGLKTRTFDIANSTTLAAGVPEMLVDVVIANGGTGSNIGAIRKTGDGVLALTAANTFTGGTTIDGGTLHLARIKADAQTGLTATASNGAQSANLITFNKPITGSMVVGQSITGTMFQSNRVITAILDDYTVQVNGVGGLSNTGSVTITSGSPILTATSTANLRVGAYVYNSNIPAGATVVSIDSLTQFTISVPASGSGTSQTVSLALYSTDVTLGAVDRAGSLKGDVTVNNTGTLLLDGNTYVEGAVTVNSGGTLQGIGSTNTVSGSTTINSDGFIKPGMSIGTLNTGNLTLKGTYVCEVDATTTTADKINVTGTVDLGTSPTLATLNVTLSGSLTSGQVFTIIQNDDTDTVSGAFSGLAENGIVLTNSGYHLKITYAGGDGNDVVLYTTPVPEPGALSLLALGALGLRRRRV